jgi:hypothetical protein
MGYFGYLSLEGGCDDVDGLRPGMADEHGGKCYPIHHLAATYFPDERWDPEHTAAATTGRSTTAQLAPQRARTLPPAAVG